MRILMVQTNSYRLLSPTPLGAALVADRLRKDGHEVRFVDLMHARSPALTACAAAAGFRPDLCCYSIRNRDNQSLRWPYDPMPEIARVIRSVSQVTAAPSLVGGTAVTTYPARVLEATGATWGLAGDDLDAVSAFVASVSDGAPDFGTPGLVYRDIAGTLIANPFQLVGYASTRFDMWDLIDLRAYRRGYWQAGVVTKSGCPEQCIFCDTFHTFGKRIVRRDPAEVAADLLRLKQTRQVRSVFLVDAGFNRPLDHAKEVLQEVIRQGAQLHLNAIHDPGSCDDEYLRLFKRAGGLALMLFAAGLSDRVLKQLRTPYTAADVESDAAAMRAQGVGFMVMPTLGSPGETPDTVAETMARSARLGAAHVEFTIGWRIQPRTALRERAVAEGVITADDDCYRATYYVSPETPVPILARMVRRYRLRHPVAGLAMLPMITRAVFSHPERQGPETV